MDVTRFKLPFGKLPPQHDENGNQQWSDYCAVTDVNSDQPVQIVIVDLVLTGLSEANATKVADVSVATEKNQTDMKVDPNAKRGLKNKQMVTEKV